MFSVVETVLLDHILNIAGFSKGEGTFAPGNRLLFFSYGLYFTGNSYE